MDNSNSIKPICGRFWGFAYLRPRTEKVVRDRLLARDIPHYLPLVPKVRLHHGSKVITEVPMIPGYIFLCASDDERGELKRREDKFIQIELLRDDYSEQKLIAELNALLKCENLAREAPIRVNPDIEAGDRVLITSGPLEGLVTEVVCRDDGRSAIIVNLTILHKHVEYPVSAEKLKKITS